MSDTKPIPKYYVGQKVEVLLGSTWSAAEVIDITAFEDRTIVRATSPSWAEWEGWSDCDCECQKLECLAKPEGCFCGCPHGRWKADVAFRYADGDDIRPEER